MEECDESLNDAEKIIIDFDRLVELYHEGAYLRRYRNKSVIGYQFWAAFWILVFMLMICSSLTCSFFTLSLDSVKPRLIAEILSENRTAHTQTDAEVIETVVQLCFLFGGCSSGVSIFLAIASYRLYAKNRRLARLQSHLIKEEKLFLPIVQQLQT